MVSFIHAQDFKFKGAAALDCVWFGQMILLYWYTQFLITNQ